MSSAPGVAGVYKLGIRINRKLGQDYLFMNKEKAIACLAEVGNLDWVLRLGCRFHSLNAFKKFPFMRKVAGCCANRGNKRIAGKQSSNKPIQPSR